MVSTASLLKTLHSFCKWLQLSMGKAIAYTCISDLVFDAGICAGRVPDDKEKTLKILGAFFLSSGTLHAQTPASDTRSSDTSHAGTMSTNIFGPHPATMCIVTTKTQGQALVAAVMKAFYSPKTCKVKGKHYLKKSMTKNLAGTLVMHFFGRVLTGALGGCKQWEWPGCEGRPWHAPCFTQQADACPQC